MTKKNMRMIYWMIFGIEAFLCVITSMNWWILIGNVCDSFYDYVYIIYIKLLYTFYGLQNKLCVFMIGDVNKRNDDKSLIGDNKKK